MSFHKLNDCLRDLKKNISKDWMDDNRERYHEVRDRFASCSCPNPRSY